MSVLDVSSRFSFTNTRPVGSPCGSYIASIATGRLIIRDSTTLERLRTVPLSEHTREFVKVSQIVWEPPYNGLSTKLAVVISSSSQVKIVDVLDETCNVVITEDDCFGVEHVEWLGAGSTPEDTAYRGSKQILVWSECRLVVKCYSLEYHRSPIWEVKKPLTRLIQHGDLFAVVCLKDQSVWLDGFVNRGNHSERCFQTLLKELTPQVERVIVSPDGKWLACSESTLGKITVSLYSTMGDVTGSTGPLFKYETEKDPLSAIDLQFWDDDYLLISDHRENIQILQISRGFTLTQSLRHRKFVDEETVTWRQNTEGNRFIKKTLRSMPQVSNLTLESTGVSKFRVMGTHVYSITQSMPTTLFIWDLTSDQLSPAEVIISNSRIKDIATTPSLPDHVVIYTDDSICIHNTENTAAPSSLPFMSEDGTQLRGLQIINNTKTTIQLLVHSSSHHFHTIQARLPQTTAPAFEHMDTQEISLIRRGSPVLIDDSSRVVELAAGVQQSEWGANVTGTLRMDDTFLGRKKARRLNPYPSLK